MSGPRIAIPVPSSTDLEYNRNSWRQYAAALERSGGEAVEIPLGLTRATVAQLIADCSGILLPGSGADVNPEKYGQEAVPECAPADTAREKVDEQLLGDAEATGKPVLAICFGTQILNVWRGGTLVQDLTILPTNHKAGRGVAVAHIAAVAPKSLLGRLIGEDEATLQNEFLRLPVNSSHHQAVGIPGDGLRVVARSSEDGVIEALEGGQDSAAETECHFVIGVQWHPERSFDISATSRALFARFVSEAAEWRARPTATSAA